jgi:uncharacterized membrane protein YjgN (DUF898 family)
MSLAAVADTSRPDAAVRFTGDDRTFRRIVVRGALLELVTFGFYRFWVTTDIRRHLWSRTEVDGDAFEYTGRGKELLIGFLLALAILGPIFLAYFLIGLEFERVKAFTSLPLYLLFIAFGQFAAYRARRYRLTRTVWRGVRFWMTGSGWSYAWRSMLWGLLLGPTLGLVYPWRMAALERFKLRHTLYGNLPGRFEATGGQLFKRVWWIWLLGIFPFALFFGSAIALAVVAAVAKSRGAGTPLSLGTLGSLMVIGFLMFFALPFLHSVRRAREWAWWGSGIRFGDVAVTCDLQAGSLIGIYWKLIGITTAVVLVFAVIAGILTAVLFAGGPVRIGPTAALLRGQLPWWGFAAYAVFYLLMIITLWVVMRIYTVQRIWHRVIDACSVVNIAATADVAAAGDIVSAFGEGLADGLDFGL